MSIIDSATLIKELRIEKGLTQAALSNGICSQRELSRIEKGETVPNLNTFSLLMQRLGENPSKYYKYVVSASEKAELDKRYELESLYQNLKFNETRKRLDEIKEQEYFKNGNGKQFVLWLESGLACNIDKDFTKGLKYAIDGIKATKPDFKEEHISAYILTQDEINLINSVAVCYYRNNNSKSSIKVLSDLILNLEKNYFDESERIKTHIKILYNYTKSLYDLEKYDKCIDYCNRAIHISNKNIEARYLPLFIGYKGFALYNQGKKDESQKYIKQLLVILDAQERYYELEQLRTYCTDELKIDIDSLC